MPAYVSPEMRAREEREARERHIRNVELAKNPPRNQPLINAALKRKHEDEQEEREYKAFEKRQAAKAEEKAAKAEQKAVGSHRTTGNAKALADKTNTTASTKRPSAAAGLDSALGPQKRRRADGAQPARPSARPAPTSTRATEGTKEKAAPKPARKPKQPVQRVFWDESSDGEESELDTVSKEQYAALQKKANAPGLRRRAAPSALAPTATTTTRLRRRRRPRRPCRPTRLPATLTPARRLPSPTTTLLLSLLAQRPQRQSSLSLARKVWLSTPMKR
jgi:hypothetical protein